MIQMKTLSYIFALFLISTPLFAQKSKSRVSGNVQSVVADTVKSKSSSSEHFAIGVDVCGAFMAAATSWGQYEASLRVGFFSPFFPVAEVGLGCSKAKNEETDLEFRTHSPYFRIGCDYNFSHRSSFPGRITAGVRYGFSRFSFDVKSPDISDPIYGNVIPFSATGIKSTMHWAELVAGLETRIVGPLSLGWTFRFRIRLAEKTPSIGHAWYVPGFGRNDSNTLGGTFNVILNL